MRPFPPPYLGNEAFYKESSHSKSYSYLEDLKLLFETLFENLGKKLRVHLGFFEYEISTFCNTKTDPLSNATLCQNLKAIGEELSEISDYVQTNIYIFVYIDYNARYKQ